MKLEPVAWALYESDGYLKDVTRVKSWAEEWPKVEVGGYTVPLYAIPSGFAVVPVEQVKDAERLDFLDGNAKFSMGWQVNKAPVGNVGVHSIIFAGRLPVTIREAIDKAMLTAAAKGE